MYVSYLPLDKEGPPMYPGSVRHPAGLNLGGAAAQNFVTGPQYPDYSAYHVSAAGLGLDAAQAPGSPWPGAAAAYGAPLREDWNGYGHVGGGAPGAAVNAVHGANAAGLAYSPAGDYHHAPHPHHPPPSHASLGPPQAHPCPGVPTSGGLLQPLNPPPGLPSAEQLSPGGGGGQRRNLCEWMRKPATAGGPGKPGRQASRVVDRGEEEGGWIGPNKSRCGARGSGRAGGRGTLWTRSD